MMDIIKANAIKQSYAITSTFLNLEYSQNADIQEELREYDFSDQLPIVSTPVLTLYGQSDSTCPPALGNDISDMVSSDDTFGYTMPNSGHIGTYQVPELFC